MDFSSPFLHAETHNARQVHHTRNRILLALWGNRSLQSTQLLLLPKNWTLDTTNHSHRQLVISVKNNPQASAMSCYIHIKMMQIYQTNNRLTKSFCSNATRSFLVSSATYKGCSFNHPTRPTGSCCIPSPPGPASSWPAWMEEPHLWDDDLCCQLSAIQLDVKSVLQDGPSCYESCIISFQSRSACKRITMASKRQNSLYKESRLLLLLSSTRGSTDSRSRVVNKDEPAGAQLVQLDVWIPVDAFRAPVGIAANDGVDVLETQLISTCLWIQSSSVQVTVWMLTHPFCSKDMFKKKVVVHVGCRSPNMYSWWMRHFLTKASRSIRQF